MFFVLSKVVGFLIEPVSLIAIFAGLAALAILFNGRKTGFAFALLAFLIAALGGWTTLGTMALAVLEDRFPAPMLNARIDGIIVLGGGFEGGVSQARGRPELRDSGDRFVEAATLARTFPDARIVVTGGSGALISDGSTDAELAPGFFARLGIDPARVETEGQSRNTDENARFVAAMINQKQGESWLLVTSAFHMPRSMGLFRKAGVAVMPWPVDYRTAGVPRMRFVGGNPVSNLTELTIAVREWTGLAAYWLTGRINDLFPAP